MHINEVERILKDSIDGKEKQYEVKRYCDHICCESDFVLLYDGMEFAYIKFDEKGNMKKKQMNIHEEKMGTASFYIVIKDSDEFIPIDLPCKVYPRNNMNTVFECSTDNLLQKLCDYRSTQYTPLNIEKVAEFFEKTPQDEGRRMRKAVVEEVPVVDLAGRRIAFDDFPVLLQNRQVAVEDVCIRWLREDFFQDILQKRVSRIQEEQIVAPGVIGSFVHRMIDAGVRLRDAPP